MTTVSLGELIQPAKVKRAGAQAYPLLSMTMHEGLVDQSSKFKKRVASDDVSDYRVVASGQLVVGFPIDEGVLDFQTRYDQGIVSPAYGVWDLINPSFVHHQYLKRYLRSGRALSYYKAKLRGTTARRRSLPAQVFLALPVPLPSVTEQRRIAAILDHADALRTNRRQVLAHLDALTQSIFHDMFGSREWPVAPLTELAAVASGITKGRRTTEPVVPVPYLAVSNVQAGHLKMDVVKRIEATEREMQRFALRDGDLVLTEGGDPDKLGRGTVWRRELPLCLHQNHIFRVRPTESGRLRSDYLAAYLASRPARSYFLKAAKQTTGIASINMTQLKSLPVDVPPVELQEGFLTRAERLNGHRAIVEHAAEKDDELFVSLQSRAFKGAL